MATGTVFYPEDPASMPWHLRQDPDFVQIGLVRQAEIWFDHPPGACRTTRPNLF